MIDRLRPIVQVCDTGVSKILNIDNTADKILKNTPMPYDSIIHVKFAFFRSYVFFLSNLLHVHAKYIWSFWFWFWFANQQDSLTNMFVHVLA